MNDTVPLADCLELKADNEALKADNEALRAESAALALRHQIEINQFKRLLEKLTFELAALKRMQFGQRSESLSLVIDDLFDRTVDGIAPEIDPRKLPVKTSREPKSAPRLAMPQDLPIEETLVDVPEAQRLAADGTALICIGEDVSDKYAYEPGRFFIRRHIFKKYAHPALPELGIKTGRTPRVVDGMNCDESLLADVLIKKFDDHLPLNRISEIYERDSPVSLAKQTLSDWVLHATDWLRPIASAILATLIGQESVLHVDETVLPLLHPVRTVSARAWAYVGASSQLIYYDFTIDKAGHHVRSRLAGWDAGPGDKYLQADAASNYDELYKQRPKIREVGCWAHARRKFFDIAQQSKAAQTAHGALERINVLFDIEREAREAALEGSALSDWRREHAEPKLVLLKAWLEVELRQIQPKTPTAGAIGYALKHWQALTRYLDHPHCSIDNNAAERALRVIAQGRKSWLFAGSEKGGAAAAVAYTLIESAKACGHNPREYLHDLLCRLPTTLQKNIDQLLPHRWTPASNMA